MRSVGPLREHATRRVLGLVVQVSGITSLQAEGWGWMVEGPGLGFGESSAGALGRGGGGQARQIFGECAA